MPRLRRLSGVEVIKILETFGFTVIRIKGSHHKLRRVVDGRKQTLHVPVHGNRPLAVGTLHSIYRDACRYIASETLKLHFYTD